MTDKYFFWLLNKVGGPNGMTFSLFRLTLKEFRQSETDIDGIIWARDSARVQDALYLREQYMNSEASDKESSELETLFVSVLEVLVAFAQRLENDLFYRPGEERITRWFWEFIENLDLDIPNSDWSEANEFFVDSQINIFIDKKYLLNGEDGNIFVSEWDNVYPMDYRKMSLWDQAQSYAANISLGLE